MRHNRVVPGHGSGRRLGDSPLGAIGIAPVVDGVVEHATIVAVTECETQLRVHPHRPLVVKRAYGDERSAP